MKFSKKILVFSLLCFLGLAGHAQNDTTAADTAGQKEKVIQFSGVVMTSDSLRAVPYAHIFSASTGMGTISNYEGFFSFVAKAGDTIRFTSIGFKEARYIIPETLQENKYSVIQLLTYDTINLPETLIYPWPTPDKFKDAFLSLEIPDDDLERAKKNLERERLKELGEQMPNDGNESQDYVMRQQAERFYYNGQVPPMNIFNPLAWAEFIKAWKRGDFKKK